MRAISLLLFLLLAAPAAFAQPGFDPFADISDGSDGALVYPTTDTLTVVHFDPADFDPPLDPDGDNIFHFSRVHIGENWEIRLRADVFGTTPVYWLAQEEIVIEGHLNLDGEDGHDWDEQRIAAWGGAGGFSGGIGAEASMGQVWSLATRGLGPGGGPPGIRHISNGSGEKGGGAGHALPGGRPDTGNPGGESYGNKFLIPLIGGSGGGGGHTTSLAEMNGSGGGGGGGAMLLAARSAIRIDGRLSAIGGGTGENTQDRFDDWSGSGGYGSGGSFRIVCSTVEGAGEISAVDGRVSQYAGDGSAGRISIEAINNEFVGGTIGPTFLRTPLEVFPSADELPGIAVTAVGSEPLPIPPRGLFTMPDATINHDEPTSITVTARHLPLGTTLDLTIVPEEGATIQAQTTPLSGTDEESTATAIVQFPRGFSRGWVQATWEP